MCDTSMDVASRVLRPGRKPNWRGSSQSRDYKKWFNRFAIIGSSILPVTKDKIMGRSSEGLLGFGIGIR